VWPFRDGRFTGIQGMNYHGGFVGAAVAVVVYTRVKRLNMLDWGDTLALCTPLGYTFGRIGNFVNEELHGRVTTVPWGVVFPRARYFPRDLDWVQSIEQQANLDVDPMARMVSLPRHASQLYEALLEGIVLWLILWFVFRKQRPFKGAAMSLYVVGYGIARLIAEFYRESGDASRIAAGGYLPDGLLVPGSPVIDTAQWLSLSMAAIGVGLFVSFRILHRPPPTVETFSG
jgi:phosphatidylglycerol:prolipoprotein diacylglycerol transferase